MTKKEKTKELSCGKFIWVLIPAVLGALFLKWFLSPSTPVGQSVPIQSRDHIQVGENHPPYNSNPPTSGWHYASSVPAGVYDEPYPDEALIHSLEHGYVIISYDCGSKSQVRKFQIQNSKSQIIGFDAGLVKGVWAHEEEEASPSVEASPSASTAISESCRHLRDDLKNLAQKLRVWKLIVIPRMGLETRLALTAWGRIDKFDPEGEGLTRRDEERIERFVRSYRDRGPEKTVE